MEIGVGGDISGRTAGQIRGGGVMGDFK